MKTPLKRLLITFLIFLVLLAVCFAGWLFARNVLQDPAKYFATDLAPIELALNTLFVCAGIIVILATLLTYAILKMKLQDIKGVSDENMWLAVSREQFRRLYDNAPVPYVTLNENGEIHEPNKATLRFFGVVPEEIVDKNLFSFQPEEDSEKGKQLLEKYKLNIPINREEIRFVNKRGEIRFVQLSIFGIVNPIDSNRTGLVAIFDITEEKELDRAKTEFVTLASHQLRTPLAAMKWYCDMFISGEMGELPPKQMDYLVRLNTINQEMIELVATLLNVSRIEIGALPIDLKDTNVKELAESVCDELSPQLKEKKISVIKNYDDALTSIQSDPKLLRIVIQNLISNSAKYTPDGGEITIAFVENGDDKRVIVSDTGYGIPQSQQGKIFTKLFRADNVRVLSTAQGTGLGLYMVKSIMTSLGGDITFTSEENKGSIFTIKI